ncbi:AAA family ATPase [Hoeflea prorocentri]|uniref:AAA family ATPase n=1 Tax=Hoeflea prorocentri TaxID=1922333 RepID=A0A9X3ZGH5_9HYPH|nr:AAA family ATPase [Hoeflea prorocentri]MCY6380234.1 AAA family ATPase [Hoeflea prorocentri]MDA5398034.1 AAA family ATPase [Hoeflea prorocentri]
MTKLRHLQVSAFRGARFPLPLDFGSKTKSLVIFGENASGKSTITDAIEWFIQDRVDHLWREDCKQEALRHVLADDDDACNVEVRFDGQNRNGTKSLSAELKTTTSFANDDTGDLVEALKGDRIILRHADIVKFLDERKGNKRKAIADIIGYEEITQFRDVIQQTNNTLKKEGAYTGAKQQSETLQGDMVDAAGQVVPDRLTFLGIAIGIVEPFNLKTVISDESSFAKALEELRGLGSSAEKIKAAERLAQLAKACDELKADIDHFLGEAATFIDTYNALAKERESVNKLRLSDFLTKGQAVIDSESYTDDACPFCLNPFDLTKLQTEVTQRLSEMAEIQGKFDTAKGLKDALLQTISGIGTRTKTISETYKDLAGCEALVSSAAGATVLLRTYYRGLGTAFDALAVFEQPEGFDKAVSDLRALCGSGAKKALEGAEKLGLTELEQKVATTLGTLDSLGRQVRDFERAQRIIDAYEAQILTLSTIFERFVTIQNAALQAVLDTISADVGAFYAKLHPKESVDNVRLTMVGEEGVEFEYSFHGTPTQPPRKYLSESHLNSLGVVLFLANARIFNKHAKFLVLDDIVTSFDTSHRRRLLRLLRDEFSDWQIIILTHENIWFDIIKKEMGQHGWLFHEVCSDDTNGILLENSPATLKEIIEQKKGKEDVTNDLRKLLELVLKNICHALEVRVAFRFNDINERRMADELISQLRSTLKSKSPDLLKTQIFSELAGSALIANLVSHDNPDKIVGEDIDVLLEDIEKLVSLFVCEHCSRHIRADIAVPGAKAISCRCGKTQIPWKA